MRPWAGKRVMLSVRRFQGRKLKFQVNEAESQVANTDRTRYLGFASRGTKIRWSDKAFREFKRRVKYLTGMTNKWLKDQGLVSVKEQWVKIHYPATAR